MRLQINLLTTSNDSYSGRLASTKLALKEFYKIKTSNKTEIKFNIYCHISQEEQWESILNEVGNDGINTELILMSTDDYMEKVTHMKTTECEYMCKWDDDVFINRHVWDYIIENIEILNNEKYFAMSPIFTNGIPSVDLFIEDFLNEEETNHVSKIFRRDGIHSHIWGCDYTELNNQIKNLTPWDAKKYWEMVESHDQSLNRGLPWYFTIVKGVHPARFSFEYNTFIANFTVQNSDKVFEKGDYYLDDSVFTPYFCNNLFVCKTDYYRQSQTEFFDHWDEGQLTTLARKTGKVPLYIRNSYGVHMAYGCTERQKDIEHLYTTEFFQKFL
jgi:hypothetical protein